MDLDLVTTKQKSIGDPMSKSTFRWFHFSVLTVLHSITRFRMRVPTEGI